MEDSCYMTRTLPSRIRLPPTSTPLSSNDTLQHLSGNATLPAPWTSSGGVNSYQKHAQSSVQQQQQQHQQQYQHLIHHQNPPPGSKGYRGMNGVSTTTPPKISNNSNQGEEVYPHHYPPPRPYSQTLPQNKYQYAPVQNTVPTYQQHQSYISWCFEFNNLNFQSEQRGKNRLTCLLGSWDALNVEKKQWLQRFGIIQIVLICFFW